VKLEVNLNEEQTQNYRNIQQKNGRIVYFFENECTFKQKPIEKTKTGHYEKVREEIVKYFYVNDDKPTGIANAFVVGENEAKSFIGN
jgi:hypothetical protein